MKIHPKFSITVLALFLSSQTFAAQFIDLKNENTTLLNSFITKAAVKNQTAETLKEINRFTDQMGVTHVRLQEYFNDYPIWNAHIAIHSPTPLAKNGLSETFLQQNSAKISMNGHLYKNLTADLKNTKKTLTSATEMEQAIKSARDHFIANQPHTTTPAIQNLKAEKLVYMTTKQQARWAYKVSFDVPSVEEGSLPAKPIYIVDAENKTIYRHWDNIKTAQTNNVTLGGGFGGNPNLGQLMYDGSQNHLAAFPITRVNTTCLLQNDEIIVSDIRTDTVMQFPCSAPDPEHNNVYWSGNFDEINQGYSPANDAMFAARVIKRFYRDWYDVSALVNEDGSDMVLRMVVHAPKMDNAYWNGEIMVFGDGSALYPLTSLGVAAHEVSHGFTQQHSDLFYDGETGGMNEAFSDMAAQTAEFYGYGKSSWMIGKEIFKIPDEAMRYMDQPSKDCYGKEPGTSCSIDRADQYYDGLDVHYSSGVYNRAFYLLSTSPGWDTRKAFAVMLHANSSYWLSETQYADGAACVIQAAKDLNYDTQAVTQAFETVGIQIPANCTNQRI